MEISEIHSVLRTSETEKKRKSRRQSEKVSKMGGNESKATVLECVIKTFKGFGGDYG